MDLAAIVVDADAVVGAEEVHAGQWRDADLGDVGAKEQAGVDRHHGAVARCHVEAVGAGDARAVEQRADLQRIARIARAQHPEMGEGRELLGLAEAGLEGQAARRDAEAGVAGHRPEIAGAQEGQQLLRHPAILEQVVDAKACKAGILRQRLGNLDLAEVEQRLVVEDLARLALLDHVHPHRKAVI